MGYVLGSGLFVVVNDLRLGHESAIIYPKNGFYFDEVQLYTFDIGM
jgi:hypothetical protein